MYKLEFSKKAKKFIDKQDKVARNRIKNSLLQLAENPYNRSLDIKPLEGYRSVYRYRIGDIRVLYEVENDNLIIYVTKIDNRGDVYK